MDKLLPLSAECTGHTVDQFPVNEVAVDLWSNTIVME